MTIEAVWSEFESEMLNLRGLHPHTVDRYKAAVDKFVSYLKRVWLVEPPVEAITPGHLSKFVEVSRASHKPTTIATNLASLAAFCKWARKRGHLKEDPFDGFQRKTPETPPPRALRVSEVMAFFDDVRGTDLSHRDLAIMKFLYYTACRPGEALSLTMDKLDMEEGSVVLTKTKGRKPRKVFFGGELKKTLQRYFQWRDGKGFTSPYVFVSRVGGPLDVNDLPQIPRRYGYDFTPYQLRHTALTQLARMVKFQTVQAIAGHANPRTTNRYVEVWDEDKQEAALALDKYDEEQRTDRKGRRVERHRGNPIP